jgi:hypothetical protein
MSVLTRSFTLGMLALGIGASALAAQQKPRGVGPNYRWYIGGQGGVYNFETTSQTRGWLPTAGLNTLIIAKRTGLLLQVDEMIGSDEVGAYADDLAPLGTRTVQFNNVRRYSAVLMAFPWRAPVEPYIGIGGGITHAVNPQPLGTEGLTSEELTTVFDQTDENSSYGFATVVAGAQLRAGPVVVFGQYQGSTGASRGKIFVGATHQLAAGVRISLGSSREEF